MNIGRGGEIRTHAPHVLNAVKAYSEGKSKHVETAKKVADLLSVEKKNSEKLAKLLKPIVLQEIQIVMLDLHIEEWNNTDRSHEYDLTPS